MKSNLFRTVLSWLLATSVILSVVFCLQFIFRTRDLRGLEGTVAMYRNRHAALQLLLTDVVNYSKTHPSINPILESARVNRGTNPPAATAPKTSAR